MKQYYILFKNHDNGMRLYNSLKSKNIKCTIAPTPRVASKSCGISLLINKDDIEKKKMNNYIINKQNYSKK